MSRTKMSICGRLCRPTEWTPGHRALFPESPTRCTVFAPRLIRRHASVAGAVGEPGPKLRPRAIDVARKIQQENGRPQLLEPPLSALQKRVRDLKRFTLQLQDVHPNVLAKHLRRSIRFQNKDLLILNKPYGVPVKEGSGATSICSVLPTLSKLLEGNTKSEPQLFPCLGLEKEVTGALLLARNDAAKEYVQSLLKENKVLRKYWVVTVGVPVPCEGVIDIPIIEKEVTGSQLHYKMALSPVYRMNETGDGMTKVRAQRQAQPAVTRYRVLDSNGGCSLVELQPLTGVKHQMRVHMSFALSCPILGDHKYSHWGRLAPQKLPEGVLTKLGLEQSKSRYLPLHLHARQLTLPWKSENDISVSCSLPKYFTQTLAHLRLTFAHEN